MNPDLDAETRYKSKLTDIVDTQERSITATVELMATMKWDKTRLL